MSNKIHLVLFLAALCPALFAQKLPAPWYYVEKHGDIRDTAYVYLYVSNLPSGLKHKDITIYANFTGSTDKRCSAAIDTIVITDPVTITTWAEAEGYEPSDIQIIHVPELTVGSSGYSTWGGSEYLLFPQSFITGKTDNSDMSGFEITDTLTSFGRDFNKLPEIIPPTSIGEGGKIISNDDFWELISDGSQLVALSDIRVSPYIYDDYGPADIYSAGASDFAINFLSHNGGERAVIQTTDTLPRIFRLHAYMANNSKQGQREKIAVQLSTDGHNWESIDTLGTDQLKPINRISITVVTEEPCYLRLQSATEELDCNTLLFDVIVTVPKVGTSIPSTPQEKTFLGYYNIKGMPSNPPQHGEILLIVYKVGNRIHSEKVYLQ